MPEGATSIKRSAELFGALKGPLLGLQTGGGLADLRGVLEALAPVRERVGRELLLNSPQAWQMLREMYETAVPRSSFLDFFWSWRSLVGGLYSVLLADLPDASVYHAVCTGYAGLLLARAHLETGRPTLLTEHGIYTNERRIEMAMATWLHDVSDAGLRIDTGTRALKDVWVDTFVAYSRACYEAATEIITLYEGNQQFQIEDGADPARMRIIPNGVDYARYSALRREKRERPTIALIGRVVPIKDVKTYIRACEIVRKTVPDLEAWVLGPTDEDEVYYQECMEMVRQLNLERTVIFPGRVKLDEYLGRIDVTVLTSISEAQPLVVLEAGSLGIPSVTTDVGSCRDLIFGPSAEAPALGPAGDVTPLCNPAATAKALVRLLTDAEWYDRCGRAIAERVRVSYNKVGVDRTYRAVYDHHLDAVGAV